MGPIYDPSVYQPPSPTRRMSVEDFKAMLEELEHKPDVDSVYEVLSNLRAQQNIGPGRMTFRQFMLHPMMIAPSLLLVIIVGAFVFNMVTTRDGEAVEPSKVTEFTVRVQQATGSALPLILIGALILLVSVRAMMRQKDPVMVEMKSLAAASITRMATDSRYIHEPFSPADQQVLRGLLGNGTLPQHEALTVLLSDQPTARSTASTKNP